MRNNTVLAAAIAVAVTLGSINGAYAMKMSNYSPCADSEAVPATNCDPSVSIGSITSPTGGTLPATVVNVPPNGIVYGSHLFGDAGADNFLPELSKAIVRFYVDGSINFAVNFTVELTNGAEFGANPDLFYVAANADESGIVTIDGGAACNGKSKCSWTVTPKTNTDLASKGGDQILDSDLFYLVYDLDNVQALATPGETIEMTAEVGSSLKGNVATGLSVTVAQSDDPLTVIMQPASEITTRISVTSGSTEFTSTNSTSIEQMSANEAVIGYVKIQNTPDVKAANGYTDWSLGDIATSTSFNAGFDENETNSESSLTITSGQFNASISEGSGSVYIAVPGYTSTKIDDADGTIEAESVTSTEAVWQLDNSDLLAIAAASNTDDRGPAIVIKTDGTNTVNIEENPPEATLQIDYVTGQKDISYGPTELTNFRQDGTTCWVYNIPPPSTEGSADVLGIRITNDSSTVGGQILGTLYPMGGESTGLTNPIFSSINLLGEEVELGAYQTVRITADDLTALGGDTPYVWWETGNRRATLHITSTLPKLEVLTILRDVNVNISTNVSTGASGVACSN